jgi:hypothetical protein
VFGDSNLIVQQVKGDSQYLDGVLNSCRDKCLDIIKLFDTFSIKHMHREENSRENQLAQQASGYIVSHGVFCVALVSLVEHRYALRSKGKPILEDSGLLRDNEKTVLGNANQLPDNEDRLPRKADLETEPSLGKEVPGPSYGCRLQEASEPISGEENNEKSVTKKSESGNIGTPIDEEKNGADEGI